MEKIRAEIRILSAGIKTIDDITDMLVASGLPRDRVIELQAENDQKWQERYGVTAKEMLEAKRNARGTE